MPFLRFAVLGAALLVPQAALPPLPSAPASGAPLRFDVAAIHPSRPSESGMIKPIAGGHGYTVQNMPVKLMISLMYRVPMRQIEGGPEWLNTERFDVEARVDGTYNVEDLHTMFQNLLADRFNLKFHIDKREGKVYALTVDKAGLKMKENHTPEMYDIPISGFGNVVGKRVYMPYLCWWLGGQLQHDERPVIDQTGLSGYYDFTLSFAPELPPGVDPANVPAELMDKPALIEAVREQLGLRLTPQKGPVPYYVIDHVEKPSAN